MTIKFPVRGYDERIISLLKLMGLPLTNNRMPPISDFPTRELAMIASIALAKGYITQSRFVEEMLDCNIMGVPNPRQWAHYFRDLKECQEDEAPIDNVPKL